MRSPISRTSRRHLLWVSAAGTAGLLPAGVARGAQTGATPEPVAEPGRVGPPDWIFQVHVVQDPYAGTIQVPQEAPPGTRFVGVEVEVVNNSGQALSFTPVDIRLRDEAGVEVRGGGALGTEPSINPRNLNPGERSRGWVWFIVPESAVPAEVVYVAPQPQFRVELPL